MTDRLVTSAKRDTDATEASLRPQSLAEFIGQEQARANLGIFIKAARDRGEALDHVLFAGPRVSARRRWRRSWPRSWASVSAPPRAP
jgi:Holliday junction resolvasome RuvABC ATP-dependent DNA helicase subunit